MNTLDTSLPPALFDVEPVKGPIGKTAAELHEGLDEARAEWKAAGYCTAATFDHDEGDRWTRTHLCTGRLGHDGPHTCDRCARTWGCELAWDRGHPFLKHSHHRCIYSDLPHTRHSCRCGLETFETEPTDV